MSGAVRSGGAQPQTACSCIVAALKPQHTCALQPRLGAGAAPQASQRALHALQAPQAPAGRRVAAAASGGGGDCRPQLWQWRSEVRLTDRAKYYCCPAPVGAYSANAGVAKSNRSPASTVRSLRMVTEIQAVDGGYRGIMGWAGTSRPGASRLCTVRACRSTQSHPLLPNPLSGEQYPGAALPPQVLHTATMAPAPHCSRPTPLHTPSPRPPLKQLLPPRCMLARLCFRPKSATCSLSGGAVLHHECPTGQRRLTVARSHATPANIQHLTPSWQRCLRAGGGGACRHVSLAVGSLGRWLALS